MNEKTLSDKSKTSSETQVTTGKKTKSQKKNQSKKESSDDQLKNKQRPKLPRLGNKGDPADVALNNAGANQNKFAMLEHMDDEDVNEDESKADWISPPSWEDDPIPWDESKPG